MSTIASPHPVASPAAAAGTSALVLEFLCLFTHDLKRKQKRWQDGRLKYHTFNRRVMVYDDRGNFIGDMHWRADWDLEAGEELQLERGGVIVQVSDCVDQKTQDLTELIDKRYQEKEQRRMEKEQRLPAAVLSRPSLLTPRRDHPPRPGPGQPTANAAQLRHRPLTALVGTPTGHHGRALVPSESPFEQRKRTDDTPTNDDASRPLKRRRYDDTPPSKLGYAQSLFGTTLTLSGAPPSSARLPSQSAPTQTHQRAATTRAPPRPTPEAEPSNMPAALPRDSGDASARRPLGPIDDRSANLPLSAVTVRHQVKKNPVTNLVVPQTKSANKAPSPKSPPKRVPRPQDITDLTLSDDDGDTNTIGVAHQSPPARPDTSVKPSTSALLLDRGISEDPQSLRAEPLSLGLGISIDDDEPLVQDDSPAQPEPTVEHDTLIQYEPPVQGEPSIRPEAPVQCEGSVPQRTVDSPKDFRRTELRLKSRKKRSLLVASELAITRRTEDATGRTPPTKDAASSLRSNYFQEAPSKPALASNAHSAYSKARTSRQDSEDSLQSRTAGDGEASVQKARVDAGHTKLELVAAESITTSRKMPKRGKDASVPHPIDELAEGPVDLEAVAVGPIAKSRRKPKRGKAASVSHPIDEPAAEPLCEPKTKRRSKREVAKRRASTATAHGETDTREDGPAQEESAPAPPRLVRLSRKSVKSKELIGYNFDDINLPKRNGSFFGEVRVEAQIQVPPSYQAPSLPVEVESHGHGSKTAMRDDDTESACLRITKSKEATFQDHPTSPLWPDWSQSDAHRSPSPPHEPETPQEPPQEPSQDPATVEVDSLVLAPAQGGAESTVDNASPPAEIRDVEAAPSTRAGTPTRSCSSVAGEKGTAREASVGQRHGDEVIMQPNTKGVDGQLGAPPRDPPRLVNPATRGRKAALKSHAAGQVPKPVLPPDVGVQPARVAYREENMAAGAAPAGIANEPPKIRMKFPGFTSAKEGGPWSREADDLLGTGRPSEE